MLCPYHDAYPSFRGALFEGLFSVQLTFKPLFSRGFLTTPIPPHGGVEFFDNDPSDSFLWKVFFFFFDCGYSLPIPLRRSRIFLIMFLPSEGFFIYLTVLSF